MMVMITELINRLEEFKDKHGDLPVYITKGFVADTEVDTVTFVRGHQCLLGNHYLDNYTSRTEWKLDELRKDMLGYANEYLDCTHCKHYHHETGRCIDTIPTRGMMRRYEEGEIASISYNIPMEKVLVPIDWKPENVFSCFIPRSHVEDDVIYRMQHYLKMLENEYDKEQNFRMDLVAERLQEQLMNVGSDEHERLKKELRL